MHLSVELVNRKRATLSRRAFTEARAALEPDVFVEGDAPVPGSLVIADAIWVTDESPLPIKDAAGELRRRLESENMALRRFEWVFLPQRR
jgi:hypothetical protein